VLDKDIVDTVVRALKFVTKRGGSARGADIHGYTEAGKTGTSMKLVGGRYSEKAHFLSFVGFAPASCPAFVLYVGLDEPWVGYIPGRGTNHRGGTSVAPIFREIGRRTLEFLAVPMDDPYGFPLQDPRCDPKRADWSTETEAIERLYKEWNG
jgi:cell division protein FtsI (penicillin-binding protein 3)